MIYHLKPLNEREKTFIHIEDKKEAIKKVVDLLRDSGIFVLSIDKNRSEFIYCGDRKIKVYPDCPKKTAGYIEKAEMDVLKQYETEFADIFVCRK